MIKLFAIFFSDNLKSKKNKNISSIVHQYKIINIRLSNIKNNFRFFSIIFSLHIKFARISKIFS